ncbi:hypothetical protein J2X68_003119 [Streptomyces sp. 3330]|uniref:hypothetical protein n=1 Tax=Streptomyces sp. 3330 TaxID=2817755 RepID=UPI0028598031|nr:hypothetical protein [Streptomyces sp. 3330]MDR6976428.1 hypothetical protein [Streptomyces sp. 3330]
MDLPAENKRTGLLALGVLGFLLIAVLTVFTVFDGDDGGDGGDAEGDSVTPTAGPDGGDAGSDGEGAAGEGSNTAVAPIVSASEAVQAHTAMVQYMAGLTTYDHTSSAATWSVPLLRLTTNDALMKAATALPTGKEWAICQAEECSSKGEAVVVRDALVSDDLVRDSGRSMSTLVKVTATRTADGQTTTESNQWLVTVKEDGGEWVVSGFDVFGLGDVGASDDSGV